MSHVLNTVPAYVTEAAHEVIVSELHAEILASVTAILERHGLPGRCVNHTVYRRYCDGGSILELAMAMILSADVWPDLQIDA